jgi:hypothetical protein
MAHCNRRTLERIEIEEKDEEKDEEKNEEKEEDKPLRRCRRAHKKTLREQMGQEEWLRFKTFKRSMTKFICTTRFTDSTWQENMDYMSNVGFKHKSAKCIYGSPFTLRERINPDAIVFVLEMNNDQNKIMGVGLIRNHPICGKHRIYQNGNYNRYAFLGTSRMAREHMTPEEEEIMKAFDVLCFKGSKHMKRGSGINLFPDEILFRCMNTVDLVEFISSMFKRRMNTKK